MEDGELDENEENEIQQQIEEEEKPEIKQIRNDIKNDKFIIDNNGNKIIFYDPDEERNRKYLMDDRPTIIYKGWEKSFEKMFVIKNF